MERKRSTIRSPGYPYIGLEDVVKRSKTLWDKDKSNPIPKEVVGQYLGYKRKGGSGGRVIAALKHFGLITEKNNDICLTQNAVDLAIYSPTSEEYKRIIENIVLNPSIYKRLHNEHNGNLPSDENLRVKLIKDYNFNPDKVAGFISKFRGSIAFAGLDVAGEINESIEGDALSEKDVQTDDNTTLNAETRKESVISKEAHSFPIPLSKGKKAVIVFETLPIEEIDIAKIEGWIELFTDVLTEKNE